jgi:hypothetical protein
LTAFNSDGFNVGSENGVNGLNDAIAAWTWDAGSSTVSNTEGSITSSVRANPSAGFSIVTYSGDSSTSGSVGHGLGVTPSMVIIKARNAGKDWKVAHVSLPAQYMLSLNQTYAQGIASWDGVTSTVFKPARVGDTYNNTSGENYVAYCFAPVSGYSSFGSYVGNGSGTDNAFVFTGFRPKWVMIKSTGSGSWPIMDSARDTYNATGLYLWSDLSNAEADNRSAYPIDFLSNGFKIRNSAIGASSTTYIYAAFAESPMDLNARAR